MILERIRELNRNYLLYLIVLSVGLYSLAFLVASGVLDFYDYLFLWMALGATFLIFYSLRFRKKEDLSVIQYIKLIVALLLPFVQMIGYLGNNSEDESLMLAPIVYFTIALFVYVFDRVIRKLWLMNRKYVTVLIIQAVLSVLIIAYAFVQQTLAKEAERRAWQLLMEADTRRREAEEKTLVFQEKISELAKELDELKAGKKSVD